MHDNIPLDIFKVIQQYLSKHDYRQLLNTNSSIFQHVKYETVYYNLQISWREIKTIEERNQVIDCLGILYGLVKDKSKQVSLRLVGFVEECTSFMSGIHQLFYYYDGIRKITNLSVIRNIYYLNIGNINHIDHLSGLSGITNLCLFTCSSISKIDFIPGLKKLVIRSLPQLLEISDYGNIPELHISGCPNLKFHGLGNHERLHIDRSFDMNIDIDIPMFRNVQYLTLLSHYKDLNGLDKVLPCFSNLTHLSISIKDKDFNVSPFPNLQHLKLSKASISSKVLFPSTVQIAEFESCVLDDLSVLSKIKELGFYSCSGRGFINIGSLSNAYKLVFCGIQELKDVGCLDRVHDLSILYCDKVKDISKLGQVHRLCVNRCGVKAVNGLGEGNFEIALSSLSKIVDFSPLRFVYKVSIEQCSILVDGRGLFDVKILTIVGCSNFTDTSHLGKVKSLYLISCSRIERLVGLENVPHIHLEDCKKLEDIDCLGKQQSLIIIDCPRLKQLIKKDVRGKYDRLFEEIKLVRIDSKKLSWKLPLLQGASKTTFRESFVDRFSLEAED